LDENVEEKRHAHYERHQPESSNDILLVGLAVQLNVCHIVKRNQVENSGRDAGCREPTLRARSTAEGEGAGHKEERQQRPLVVQTQREMVQPLQQAAVDRVVSCELERAVLLS
jgi:hypothetical protein